MWLSVILTRYILSRNGFAFGVECSHKCSNAAWLLTTTWSSLIQNTFHVPSCQQKTGKLWNGLFGETRLQTSQRRENAIFWHLHLMPTRFHLTTATTKETDIQTTQTQCTNIKPKCIWLFAIIFPMLALWMLSFGSSAIENAIRIFHSNMMTFRNGGAFQRNDMSTITASVACKQTCMPCHAMPSYRMTVPSSHSPCVEDCVT